MRSAQRLEGRLQILFGIHNVISGISKAPSSLTDSEFEALLTGGDEKTLGEAVRGVFQKLAELGLSGFPDNAQKALWHTVRTRNFVAHHYFAKHKFLAQDENARRYLIDELDWYSELFQGWVPTLDKWTQMLLNALGIEDDLESAQEVFKEVVPDLRREQLNLLKDRLARIGIEVPDVPAGPERNSPELGEE